MNPHQQIETWLAASTQAFQRTDRPFVTLSYAQSLDGSISLDSGSPLALSGRAALALTHQLRSLHQGVLVGIGTVLSDDPQLNVRHWQGGNPQPIVLDSQLRLPETARLRQSLAQPCWVLTTPAAPIHSQTGIEVLRVPSNPQGRVCLAQALPALRAKGITSLMVEGGGSVISAFLAAQLVDAVVVTLVPRLLGGYKAVTNLSRDGDGDGGLPHIGNWQSATLGADMILWGNLGYSQTPSGSSPHG